MLSIDTCKLAATFLLSSHLQTSDTSCTYLAHQELDSINVDVTVLVLFTPSSLVGAGSAAYFLLFKHTLQIGPGVNLRMLCAAACHLKHVSPSAFSPQPFLHPALSLSCIRASAFPASGPQPFLHSALSVFCMQLCIQPSAPSASSPPPVLHPALSPSCIQPSACPASSPPPGLHSALSLFCIQPSASPLCSPQPVLFVAELLQNHLQSETLEMQALPTGVVRSFWHDRHCCCKQWQDQRSC